MYWDIEQEGGFNFEKFERNKMLEKKGMQVRTKKTGTTIVGVVYKDGVILGADTRATEGSIVADPDCLKIHYLAPNIYCCGAGTAADTEFVTQMMASELELHRLNTKRESRVSQVEARLTNHLFKYRGQIGAALIVGGVDVNGPSLVNINLNKILLGQHFTLW
jgi:20S proteasome subunit beta 2